MDSVSASRIEWSLTGEAFARFLSCLDSDTERAGEKYESVRLMLLKFFDWRGAHFPEECADETINRVIRKIDEGETIRDIPTYCQGVARLVFLETLKRADSKRADIEEVSQLELAAPEPETEDPRLACFNRCLAELPPESRQLIMQYYQDEKRARINNRQSLAERLGLPLNALRSRAQRIRNRLEECVSRCLKKE
ncbi:MAG: sigma-70 family RNA polymerase sigma factor [Blastocatellia bacterium]